MKRSYLALGSAWGISWISGCGPAATVDEPRGAPPAISRPAERQQAPVVATRARAAEVSWETPRDRPFAEFLRDNSGGMVHEASVSIEKQGRFQVVLDRSVAPEDTLDLTKSLMSGARKDFPDRPITLAVFDPSKTLILRAIYKVGQGVNFQVAQDGAGGSPRPADAAAAAAPARDEASTRSGTTEADRKFAEWAEGHGKTYLRYVEADLERHGRLWFGVTRDVQPADVPNLTKSLLEGAHKEFPRGELVATVFDPEGNKIGKATLGRDGSVSWER